MSKPKVSDEMVWAMFSAIAEELSTDPDNPEVQPSLLALCRRGLNAALGIDDKDKP